MALAPALLLALWGAAGTAFVASTLDAAARGAWLQAIEPLAAPLLLMWLLLSGLCGWAVDKAWTRWVAPPAQLAEQAQMLVAADTAREIPPLPGDAQKALRQAINALARQRGELRADMARQVQAAVEAGGREIEHERSRLAALMSELTQSVVVCNLDGRVLLYNNRARIQFRALSDAPALADGAELIGLGRSIYAVFDRKLVAHALESIRQRMQRGAAQPSAQFVTATRGGQLLRAQMAPVRGSAPAGDARGAGEADAEISGFVLMLDNITRDFADESQRDRLLHAMAEGSRASLGNLQAALEMLEYPDLDEPTRERFLGVIRDEARAMGSRLNELASHSAQTQKTRWPLEDMLGADLVAAAQRRIEALYDCRMAGTEVDASLWLRVDSFSLLQALAFLAGRLVEDYEIRTLQLRLAPAPGVEGRAQLDLLWLGQAMSTETVIGWETESMKVGNENMALSVRDVVERHGGEFWFERERVRQAAFFRFLLPLADARAELDASLFVRSDSRPEYYDFDLFRASEPAREWAERRLVDLTFTVFDTETTGLNPSQGDEIIQIGAARIVNGKLRRQECFEQLVDPQRVIPPASIPIHGIRPEMVVGQPTLPQVLPSFHAFAHDSVLVAHNAAFDMRFLQLKEEATGVKFDQPVLDTLLLSAVVHPNQQSHGLEAIAERLDVPVMGRHTALGDAMVTAEVFLKLLPLLAEMGIHTLGQAREAAQKTYYARISY
jgi:DNA polymerase III subunit epsilon